MTRRVLTYVPIVSNGGAERVAVDVLNGLAAVPDCQLEQHLVTDRAQSTFLDQLSDIVRVHHINDDLAPWHRARRLGHIADSVGPDIIVAHMSHSALTVALTRLRCTSARRARLIAVEHSLPRRQFDDRAGLREAIIRRLLRPVYRRADSVVCISDSVQADLRQLLGDVDNLLTIRNGVDLDRVRRLAEETPSELREMQQEGRTWLVAVGRLVPMKNHELTLRVLQALTRDHPMLGLLIVGDGPLRTQLMHRAAELGIADRVRFTGFLHNPFPLVRAASVVVSASTYEGLGLALIESLALGRQIAAVTNPGVAEVLCHGEAGFLCGNDASSMAAAIRSALRSPIPTARLRARADEFRLSECVRAYYDLLTTGPSRDTRR